MKGSLGHFGITLESLLVCEGPLSKKHSFCPIDVNDLLYNSGVNLRSLRGHVEVLWVYGGDLGSLLDHSVTPWDAL